MIYTFDFSEDELNIIVQGLGELPAKLSVGLLTRLQSGYNAQNKKNEGAVSE